MLQKLAETCSVVSIEYFIAAADQVASRPLSHARDSETN